MIPLPIYVDLSEIGAQLSLTTERMEELSAHVLDKLSQRYSEEWTNLVTKNLRSTRQDYLRAMSYDRISSNEAIFTLHWSKENPLPIMLEVGCEPFDEKIGFAQSSKKKMRKGGGWYLTIPFRHATSEALGEAGFFNSIMPKQIEILAKKADQPLKQKALPQPLNTPGQRDVINRMNKNVEAYKHKFSIYAGLVRKDISSTVKENRGGYFTFRRVSDKSDPLSWWHEGFEKHDFMGKALKDLNIQTTVAQAIDNFFGL